MGDCVGGWRLVLAAPLAIAAGCLFQSCSNSGSREVDVGGGPNRCPDVPPPYEPNPFDGVKASFVIDSIRIGNPDDGEGFNLDCASTGPEGYQPADGPWGTDNQFGALVMAVQDAGMDIDVDGDMRRSIEEGRNLLLFRLLDVDDWADDGGAVYLAVHSGVDTDSDPTNNLTGHGELLVDEDSLTDPDDLDSARALFVNGVLADTAGADGDLRIGDYSASGADVTIALVVSGTTATLPIHDAQIVWDLGTAPVGDPPLDGSAVQGMLGGSVFLDEGSEFIAIAYRSELGPTIDADTIRVIAAGQADLDVIPEGFTGISCTEGTATQDCAPGQGCERDPDRGDAYFCYEYDENPDAISVAFVFTAVSCNIVGIYHGAP
ncbi:MAG: hypothetical protein HY905_12950 [Deltaproteobacteria bacterium]|nr:hypothetical protein [Deltaproteobacteria bacterium]